MMTTKSNAMPTNKGSYVQKFALWLFMASVVMIFAALTSAYIVKQAEGKWLYFDLPTMFTWSTLIILLSSGTMHWALKSAKADNIQNLKLGLLATTFLGLLFLVMQVLGWQELAKINIYFSGGNAAGSFVYVFSGLHGAHIISAIVVLLFSLYSAFAGDIHSKKLNRISLCASYWHFLDIIWIYLFVFLLIVGK